MITNLKENSEKEKCINKNSSNSSVNIVNYASSGSKKGFYQDNSGLYSKSINSKSINSKNINSQNNIEPNNNKINSQNSIQNNINIQNNIETNNNNINFQNSIQNNIEIINNDINSQNSIQNVINNQNIFEIINKIINSQNSNQNRRFVGKGGFGKVYKYKGVLGVELADKIIEKENKESYEREVEYLKLLKKSPIHNYIIEIYHNYEDEEGNFHIIMEPYEGNLKDLMDEKFQNGFYLNVVQKIMKIINIVVKYLNDELNILHNDIKPENILYKYLDREKDIIEIKLCDFGLVCLSQSSLITNKREGTKIYWDEHKKEKYDKNNYLYNPQMNELKILGNVMYELAFNNKNFNEDEIKKKLEYIQDEDFKNILKYTCILPDYLKPNLAIYFNLNFFKKKYPANNNYDSITLKQNFKFEMNEAINLAKKITNYSKKDEFQKNRYEKTNIFSVKLDKNSKYYSSFVKDSIFHVVYYENSKIKILKEIQSKYSDENEIIKEIEIDQNLNVKEIKFNSYFNCIFIFSEEIKYIDIYDNFNIYDLFKETKVKFASILNKNQNDYLLLILNDNLELFSFKLLKENNIFKLIKDEYEMKIENNDKNTNFFYNTICLNNNIYFYYYSDFKYYIYTFDENKNISKKEDKSEVKIKNLLITHINNEVYLIFLTEKENKYLINIQKYDDNKQMYITHNLNSEIKKIELINDENLLVLCFSTFQILNLKENYWLLHSPYITATNQINECISVYHPYYKESLLVLVNQNSEKKNFLLYYKTSFSDDYWKLKAIAIKKLNNEYQHEDIVDYLYKKEKLNSDEIKIILRLMSLNNENIKVKNYILDKKKH